ncbi:MAG TPA: hypothetical protein VGM84_19245 [Steroidobacteraceae bacterium]|jgi:hypothetical protein
MKHHISRSGLLAPMVALAWFGSTAVHAAEPPKCSLKLTVQVSAAVPDAHDDGFLSSLLSNNPAYRLDYLKRVDPSTVALELSGPGTEAKCQEVVASMRKDARISAIQAESETDIAAISVAGARDQPVEVPRLRVAPTGVGSLYWAARHPSEAWKILAPVSADDLPYTYLDMQGECHIIRTGQAQPLPCW